MTGTYQVIRACLRVDGGENRLRAGSGGAASRDGPCTLNGDGEGRAGVFGFVADHEWQVQLIDALWSHREADQTPPVHGHKVDGIWADLFRCHDEITRVAMLVINQHDHATCLELA